MLDQSFSAHNFCTIYNIENRKGHIELDDMPTDFRECVTDIKQNKTKIQEIKDIAEEKRTDDEVMELEKAQTELERLYESKESILDQYLNYLSSTIRQRHFKITLTKYIKDGKEIFYLDSSSHAMFFAAKQLQYNIHKTFKVKQSNRNSILSCIKSLLETKRPISIIRTDISSFYESIDQKILLNRIEDNTLLSPKSRAFIKAILNQYNNLKDASTSASDKGIPRGVGISAYLSELYLKDLDTIIKSRPEVMFYARYVDDIFIILSCVPVGQTIEAYYQGLTASFAEIGLSLKRPNDGSGKCQLITFNNDISIDIQYLGYRIVLCRTKDKLSVTFHMSTNKVNKIKRRIDAAFLHFENLSKINIHDARKDLIDSLNFITGNFSLCKSKTNVKIGLFYNNSLLDSKSDLDELTNYLHGKIITPYFLLFHGNYGSRKTYISNLRRRIESFDFSKRWTDKNMYKFSLSRLKQINSWL